VKLPQTPLDTETVAVIIRVTGGNWNAARSAAGTRRRSIASGSRRPQGLSDLVKRNGPLGA